MDNQCIKMLLNTAHRQTLALIHHPDHQNQPIRWCTFINLRIRNHSMLNCDWRDSRNSSGLIIPESEIRRHKSFPHLGLAASLTSAFKRNRGVALMRLRWYSWSIRVFAWASAKELRRRSQSNRCPANSYNLRCTRVRMASGGASRTEKRIAEYPQRPKKLLWPRIFVIMIRFQFNNKCLTQRSNLFSDIVYCQFWLLVTFQSLPHRPCLWRS
jgi:hypothetical protein